MSCESHYDAIRRVILEVLDANKIQLEHEDLHSVSLRVFMARDYGEPVTVTCQTETRREVGRRVDGSVLYRNGGR